jgi:hypothetical protein
MRRRVSFASMSAGRRKGWSSSRARCGRTHLPVAATNRAPPTGRRLSSAIATSEPLKAMIDRDSMRVALRHRRE